ncbi:hypothetical protein WUBG_08030 [Wuchereria bancrofti]|uniref:Uncharacterized protein n=1 Tax=Wuchereria bancrofti TaxID=6293 RepID=J9F136_WUCBA|nr:hypothetical protein WUBG_08030 [Wuchereria bancrofti]
MTLPRQFLSRCPSCLTNFVQLWCDFTCSPNQANFVRVIASTDDLHLVENKTQYVTEVAYYVRESYADGLFQSCKDVRAIGTDYALSFMCGVSITECDISRWFTFLGTYNEDIGVPFHITFIPTPSLPEDQSNVLNSTALDIRPPTTRVLLCSEAAYPNGPSCSCQDCPQSCVAESPFPFIVQEECQVASFDCMLILSLFGFGGLCFAVLFFAMMYHSLKRNQDGGDLSDFKPAGGTLDDADLGAIDTLGSWIESQLELVCAHYGQLCVKHPLAVFAFGTLIAVLCSSGMLFVRFTTDPVELWSSRTSRARGEKYFFDSEFGPFYRMEQLIMYPRDQSFWLHENQSDLFELGFYGPALRKAFLQDVLS